MNIFTIEFPTEHLKALNVGFFSVGFAACERHFVACEYVVGWMELKIAIIIYNIPKTHHNK